MESKEKVKKRPILVTIYFIASIILTSLSFLTSIPLIGSSVLEGALRNIFYILLLACIFKIIGDILILTWKKVGAYLSMIGIFLNFMAVLGIGSSSDIKSGGNIFSVLIGTIVWFIALYFVWSGLEPIKKEIV